jgi:nitrate/nitrite-specific signal transduction histidine kinase
VNVPQKNNSTGFNRTHFFIDRKFQGRYMLTMLIPMLILLGFMLITLYMATQTLLTTTVRIVKTDIESRIALELQDQQSPSIEKYKALVQGISEYLRDFSASKEFKMNLMFSLLWVFGTGVFLVMVQIVLLTIFFSHKVAGPVFRLEKTCHSMIQGSYTNEIHLRKGDEMQNLAMLLNEANNVTRQRLHALKDAANEEERDHIVKGLQI